VLAVYGSVSVIADALAVLPWDLFTSDDPAKRRKLPLTAFLKKPYVEISRMDWLTQYATSMALRGNFYGEIVERDQDFYPAQVKPIHPDRARVRRLPNGTPEYRFNGRVVPIDNVFHTRNLSLAGSLVGLNPIENLRLAIGLARMQDAYGAAYFTNSANPEGVIEVEDDLDVDEAVAMGRAWVATHGGVGKSHLPGVLTGGATFKPISINPKDSQFLESREWSAGQISGAIFKIPPHMLGMVDKTTSWGKGIESQERGFVRNTLGRYIGALDEIMTEYQPNDRYVRFNLAERLRGDKLERSQAHALDLAAGWKNPDEVRSEEDLPPVPDGHGKNFFVPINSELLAQALQSMKDSKDAADQAAIADAQGGGTDG
jgi:HK97 family phage portal protein